MRRVYSKGVRAIPLITRTEMRETLPALVRRDMGSELDSVEASETFQFLEGKYAAQDRRHRRRSINRGWRDLQQARAVIRKVLENPDTSVDGIVCVRESRSDIWETAKILEAGLSLKRRYTNNQH